MSEKDSPDRSGVPPAEPHAAGSGEEPALVTREEAELLSAAAATSTVPRRGEHRPTPGAEQPDRGQRPARLEEQLAEARAWARAEYWQRWDLGVTDPDHPPAWLMVDAPDAREETLLDADLNAEDDDGNNWTLVMDQFDPARVYPGARLLAGRPGFAARAQVLRTELLLTTSGAVRVLVTFRQTALRTLEEALGAHTPKEGG